MTAAAKGPGSGDDGTLATQWFIVSDMGPTAFPETTASMYSSIHWPPPIRSQRSVRLVARNNRSWRPARPTRPAVLFEAGLALRRGADCRRR